METNYWSQAEYEWNRKTNDEKKEYFKRQVDIALTCYFNYCSNEEILNFSECLYNKS